MQKLMRSSTKFEIDSHLTLISYLANGWHVVMCNKLDEDTLEYVIEPDWHGNLFEEGDYYED